MYNGDRMMLEAEMKYRSDKMRRAFRPKRRNRFVELHQEPTPGAVEAVKRAR